MRSSARQMAKEIEVAGRELNRGEYPDIIFTSVRIGPFELDHVGQQRNRL